MQTCSRLGYLKSKHYMTHHDPKAACRHNFHNWGVHPIILPLYFFPQKKKQAKQKNMAKIIHLFFGGAPSRHRSPKRKVKINDRTPAPGAPLLAPPGMWHSKPLASPRRDGPSKWHSSSSSVALLAPGRAGNGIGSVAWVEKCALIYSTWKKQICQIWLSWVGEDNPENCCRGSRLRPSKPSVSFTFSNPWNPKAGT